MVPSVPLNGRARLRVAGMLSLLLLAIAIGVLVRVLPQQVLLRPLEQLERLSRSWSDPPRSLVPAVEAYYQQSRSGWPEQPARAADALSREAELLHRMLETVATATSTASERQALDAAEARLAQLRWTYAHTRLGEEEYAVLLEQLETLVRAHALTPQAQQAWNEQAGISIAHSEAGMFRAQRVAQAGPGHFKPALDQSSAGLRHELGRVAGDLLASGGYDALEDLGEVLRKGSARFPGGEWCLRGYYDGLGDFDDSRSHAFEIRRGQLESWRTAKPRSLAAPIALARLLVAHAWRVRGHGAADQLSVEQQAGFVHWLDQAAAELQGLDPRHDPEIFRLLMETAFANTAHGAAAREDMDAVYAAAVRRFPDYYGLYALRAWQLMPQWLGERGEHAAYLKSLLGDPAAGGSQPALAFALMGTLSRAEGIDLLTQEELPWPEVQAAFASQERRYGPGSESLNALMILALINGDRAMVARTADRLGMLWEAPWFSDEARFAAAVAWASAPEPGKE